MRKPIHSLFALSLVCCPLAANAAGMMKQGLWEMTAKSGGAGAGAQIPPEKLEELRKRGISIPQTTGGAMVTKMCVSKEMAGRDSLPPMNRGGANCAQSNQSRSGNTLTFDVVCTGENMQGKGTTKVTYGDDSFSSVTDFTGTAHGHPINTHNETSGRYLGADCGNVQPPPMPK